MTEQKPKYRWQVKDHTGHIKSVWERREHATDELKRIWSLGLAAKMVRVRVRRPGEESRATTRERERVAASFARFVAGNPYFTDVQRKKIHEHIVSVLEEAGIDGQ